MTMLLLTITLALAGRWDDAVNDVEAQRTMPRAPAEVYEELSDLATYKALFPEDCARDWLVTQPTTGIDAQITVRYTFGPLRRKLTAVITKEAPGSLWQLEHKGNRGWYTQFRLAEGAAPGETHLTLLTPLAAPPWPFRGIFHKRVRPAMQACYTEVLSALEARVAARPRATPVDEAPIDTAPAVEEVPVG